MRVLGIDPGLAITGYGLIDTDSNHEYLCIDYGVITTPSSFNDSDRLQLLYDELTQLLINYKPDVSSIEKLFFQKNVKTAIAVGQARGVVLLALSQSKLPVWEYTPNEIKQTVCGYGSAGKQQVQRMVQMLLSLEDIPAPDDAADALAAAICQIHHQSFLSKVNPGAKP